MTTTYGGPRKQTAHQKGVIGAAALRGYVTNGAGDANGLPERRAVSGVNVDYIAFDPTTAQTAFFLWSPPDQWDKGKLTFAVKWIAASGSGAVVWGLGCHAADDGDGLAEATDGTEVTVTDTLLGSDTMCRSPESGEVTPSEIAFAGNIPVVYFRIRRVATDSADTLAVDAELLEVEIYFNTRVGVEVPEG